MASERAFDERQTEQDLRVERDMLLSYVEAARAAIAELRPAEVRFVKLPLAMSEIGMIVETTESAANRIMEAAEGLMKLPDDLPQGDYREHVQSTAIAMMEACSFQDLTGQRITKVVETLMVIEDKLGRLSLALGDGEPCALDDDIPPRSADEVLLNGPCMPGQGVDQDEIDRLFAEG